MLDIGIKETRITKESNFIDNGQFDSKNALN